MMFLIRQIYLPWSKLGNENIVMHRSDWIVFKPNFLTALRNPLYITTIHYPLVWRNGGYTIRMFECSMGITFFFLRMTVFRTFNFEFEGKGVKIGGCRLSVGAHWLD